VTDQQRKEFYTDGFCAGMEAAVTLSRAGARPDDLAVLLPADPGRADPRGYCDTLSELRRIMGSEFGGF
jgi:hypothetical protein